MLRDWRETQQLVIGEREGERSGNSHRNRGRRKHAQVLKTMEKLRPQ